MSSTLVIERKKAFVGCARKLKVLVGDREIGSVANGKTESFPIPAGLHQVSVQMGSAASRPLQIEAAEGQSTKLFCNLKMGWFAVSDFVLTREDGTGADASSAPAKHHAKLVLVFGLLGFLVGLLGLAALGQGIYDIRKMNRGEMDASGKTMTLAGAILGGIGFVLNLAGKLWETFGQ